MSELYELTSAGVNPVLLAEMKAYLKDPPAVDDTFITELITAATQWGEDYTGHEFRANTWKLFIDEFTTRIIIRRSPVDSITSINHLVSDVLTLVPGTNYYLKKLLDCAEILLIDGMEWPTNTDVREHAIEIIFVTSVFPKLETIKTAIMQHVAYMYNNRGDCTCSEAGKLSGASALYDIFTIQRI